jgi:hypothetical protein
MALFQHWVRRLQAKKLPGENDLLWPSAGSKSILGGQTKKAGITPGPYASQLGGDTRSPATSRV